MKSLKESLIKSKDLDALYVILPFRKDQDILYDAKHYDGKDITTVRDIKGMFWYILNTKDIINLYKDLDIKNKFKCIDTIVMKTSNNLEKIKDDVFLCKGYNKNERLEYFSKLDNYEIIK